MIEIRRDDLSGAETQALLRLHLAGMHAASPPEAVFALDLSGLLVPEITVWSAWRDGRLAGIGALKELGDGIGELKSMRTHPDHLRAGVARALLEHIIGEAKARGLRRISLETGRGAAFDAAIALYQRRGFVLGPAFGSYLAVENSSFSQFLHLDL